MPLGLSGRFYKIHFDSDPTKFCSIQTMVVGSKRRALAFYLPVRIYYMCLLSKCREQSDLGLCMSSGLAKRMTLQSANF